MELADLLSQQGEWLRGEGPQSDIVVSSRIRLARNLVDFPFVGRATEEERQHVEETLRRVILDRMDGDEMLYVDVESLPVLDRRFLVERQLISRELADGEGARAVAVHAGETFSLMINEEDHLRIQVMQSGFDLETAWKRINHLDDLVEADASYAFHEEWGYLTACPTNVGTGMRVSVLLHLPALVLTGQIEKVFRALQKVNLAVRGLYGEGSQAIGDFYQISNQITLGRTEDELIKQVSDIVPVIIEYERHAREALIKESKETIHDRVCRAIGILRTAQTIGTEEAMHHLSSIRVGIQLGLTDEVSVPKLNEMLLNSQPGHVQKRNGSEMEASDRDIARARYLRSQFGEP